MSGECRVGGHPLPPEAVLDQVLDDPIGREKLGGGGDVLALDHLADHFGLLLGDVELVQPADDLDLLPVLFVDALDQLADQRVGVEQIIGQEQFGLVVNRLEQERHRPAQGVALGNQQQPVEFGLLVAVELEFDHLRLVEARQLDMFGMFHDLGQRLALRVAEHPVAVVEIAMKFHEPDGHEPVEPGVGHLSP